MGCGVKKGAGPHPARGIPGKDEAVRSVSMHLAQGRVRPEFLVSSEMQVRGVTMGVS